MKPTDEELETIRDMTAQQAWDFVSALVLERAAKELEAGEELENGCCSTCGRVALADAVERLRELAKP